MYAWMYNVYATNISYVLGENAVLIKTQYTAVYYVHTMYVYLVLLVVLEIRIYTA